MPTSEAIVLISCTIYLIGIGFCSYYLHSSNNYCCREKEVKNDEYCEI